MITDPDGKQVVLLIQNMEPKTWRSLRFYIDGIDIKLGRNQWKAVPLFGDDRNKWMKISRTSPLTICSPPLPHRSDYKCSEGSKKVIWVNKLAYKEKLDLWKFEIFLKELNYVWVSLQSHSTRIWDSQKEKGRYWGSASNQLIFCILFRRLCIHFIFCIYFRRL